MTPSTEAVSPRGRYVRMLSQQEHAMFLPNGRVQEAAGAILQASRPDLKQSTMSSFPVFSPRSSGRQARLPDLKSDAPCSQARGRAGAGRGDMCCQPVKMDIFWRGGWIMGDNSGLVMSHLAAAEGKSKMSRDPTLPGM